MHEPLMHAITNAMDHGLETPDLRRACGKPRRGVLRLKLDLRADRVLITIEDDGRGMDPAEIKRRAVDLGLIDRDTVSTLTDDEALMLTTLPSLSTKDRVDHVSGRGVGLDVVRDAAKKLGGLLQIRSRPGQGCRLLISVPPSQALIQTLLVRSMDGLYAIPIEAVDRTHRIGSTENPVAGTEISRLSQRLGVPGDTTGDISRARAVILREPCTTGILVDEVLGRRDVVVRPLGRPLIQMQAFSGAALLEDGAIALVLDPFWLSATSEAVRQP